MSVLLPVGSVFFCCSGHFSRPCWLNLKGVLIMQFINWLSELLWCLSLSLWPRTSTLLPLKIHEVLKSWDPRQKCPGNWQPILAAALESQDLTGENAVEVKILWVHLDHENNVSLDKTMGGWFLMPPGLLFGELWNTHSAHTQGHRRHGYIEHTGTRISLFLPEPSFNGQKGFGCWTHLWYILSAGIDSIPGEHRSWRNYSFSFESGLFWTTWNYNQARDEWLKAWLWLSERKTNWDHILFNQEKWNPAE